MSKRIRVKIYGRVHGVFFRASLRREAVARGVVGWVRNVTDGTVEAVLEGDDPDVGGVLEFCRRGPEGARVDRVDVGEDSDDSDLDRFEIRLG
jgi:acylphosphatase